MKRLIMALSAIALLATMIPAKAGTNCTTTCSGSGSTRNCNTYCN